MKIMPGRDLVSVMALAAALIGSPAMAEEGAAAAPAADAAPTGDSTSQGVGDIIVTAQRRSENVQKSSLSVQVLSHDDLVRTGVTNPRDLNNLVPGLAVSQGGTFTQTFIRGVGDITSNAFGSNGVLYSIDGVVIDRPTSIAPNFYDLERIEVLKGPQGTLYGRNSTGGAINLLSRRPDDKLGGYVTVEGGNYNTVNATGALNVPVSADLKVRGAFQIARHDGYLSDGRNDQDQRSGRISALYTPSEDFSLLIIGDIQHMGGKGPGGALLPLPAGASPWTGPSDPLATSKLPPIAVLPDANTAFISGNFRNIMGEANIGLGFAKLTLLGGYRYVSFNGSTAQPGFTTGYTETAKQASFEARLGNQTPELKWVLGAIYFDEKQSATLIPTISKVVPFLFANVDTPKLPTKSYGFFGQATYSLTESLRAIGGLRYTHEEKSLQGSFTDLSTANVGSVVFSGNNTYQRVTWKVGAEYDLSPQNMLYATVSTGFKAGGFSAIASANNQFKPETLTSYVAGLRNRFLDNKLQVNLEGFYWKYKDYQASILQPQANGFTGTATINAGAATIYGMDIDVVARITPRDTLRFVGEYLHTKFDSFTFDRSTSGLVAGRTTGCAFVGAPRAAVGGNIQTLDCSGFPLQRSPKFSGTTSYDHVFPLGNGGNVDFRGTLSFASTRWIGIEYLASELARPYATVDADLTYHAPEERFTISAFVRNLGNKPFYSNATLQPLSGGSLLFTTINAPRTYGLRASVNF